MKATTATTRSAASRLSATAKRAMGTALRTAIAAAITLIVYTFLLIGTLSVLFFAVFFRETPKIIRS